MAINENFAYFAELPFHDISGYDNETEFSSTRQCIQEEMNNNNNLLEYLRENNFHHIFSFENSLPCQYYDEDIFIKLNRNDKRFCNIFSLSIRCLPRNGGELLYSLQTLKTFLILTEIGARNPGLIEHLLATHTFYRVTPDNNNWRHG